MSYKSNLQNPAKTDRKTGADGVWFTTDIIKVNEANISGLAEALDNLDITNLPDVKSDVLYGQAAYDLINSHDMAGISASAASGAAASNALKQWTDKFPGIENSAKSGAMAFNKIKPYNFASIKTAAEQGQDAYNRTSTAHFQDIANSAKNGAAAWTAAQSIKTSIDTITPSLISNLTSSASQGKQLADALTTAGPKFNGLVSAVNTSAGYWNANLVNAANWNTLVSAVNASADRWDAADWSKMNNVYTLTTASGSKWSSVLTSSNKFNELLTLSSHVNDWNNMLTSYKPTNWEQMTSSVSNGSGKWLSNVNTITTNSANWNGAYNAITASSTKWNGMALDQAKWNSAYTAVTASAAKWNGSYSSVTASAAKWNDTYNTVTAGSAKWDLAYTSATRYADAYTVANAGLNKWWSAYSGVSASATYWDTALGMYSAYPSKSASMNIVKTMAAISAKSGTDWKKLADGYNASGSSWEVTHTYMNNSGVLLNNSGYYIKSAMGIYNSRGNTVTANSAQWAAGYTFWKVTAPTSAYKKTSTVKSATVVGSYAPTTTTTYVLKVLRA